MSGPEENQIIDLEKGYSEVYTKGIQPFIRLVETQEREFFKAAEFVALYDLIFKMCIQRDPFNWSEAMYERYTQAILDYIQQSVIPALNEAKTQYEVTFLKQWCLRWHNHKLVVKGLSKLFMYLDRFFTPNTDGVLSLKEQGFKLYKEQVFDQFAPEARKCILHAIERERNSEEQDRQLLQEAVLVFVEMGHNFGNKKLKVYKQDLEKYIVEHAGAHYKRMSRIWLDEDSCPSYLEKAERMLNAEKGRVEAYLNRTTLEPLLREVYTQLLKVHQAELLRKKTGIFHMLATDSIQDLARLYKLFKRFLEDLVPISEMFHEHVRKEGLELVDRARPGAVPAAAAAAAAGAAADGESKEGKEEKEAASSEDVNHALVRNLIALHQRYAGIVSECFQKAQLFQKALKRAFEDFINKDNRVSKLLAKFVNDVLKKGSKVNVKDLESTLDNVVFLYGYIQEKDVFERDYQLYLANRLLNGLCESEHSEKAMIAKLKGECGYQWTNKLEGMFKDVQLSKDLMAEFRKAEMQRNNGQGPGPDEPVLEVNVCTTGYWPASKATPGNLPKELQPVCERFRQFYLGKHSGHKLEWRLDQGQAEIVVEFAPGVKRALVCTTYQMMIFLVFNTFKVATYRQILDVTGIPPSEIANHLLSLAHPKVHLILKKPDNKKLEDDHKFMINPKYKNQLKKVIVPLLKSVSQDKEESSDAKEKATIELQRRHQMDAAIVRIMKARKKLRHNLLVAEVIQQLSSRFQPKPNDIKKRIEALIEQEYLERDAQDRGVYNYLA